MTDLSITAANVKASTGATRSSAPAGETITAGQSLYVGSDSKVYKSDANGTALTAAIVGIALNGAALDQPVFYQTGGAITIGATVVVGGIYVASGTAGGIAPFADLGTNDYVSIIGYGQTAAIILMDLNPTGIQHA